MKTRTTFNHSAAVLWASAFVIIAMIILQAGRMSGNAAYAEMSSTTDVYSLLTTNSGRGGETEPDELLYVINNREGIMMVYEIEDARKRQVLLRDGGRLEALFQAAN